jgi:2-methylcitrate dehydratase PrpD
VSDYSLTKEAADFAVDLDFEDFDAEVLRIARRCVLDGLAVALAGSEQPAIDVVERYTRKVGGASDARVIGDANLRLPAHLAAFWNGLAGHAMDWDDTHCWHGRPASRWTGDASSPRSWPASRWSARSPRPSTPTTT